VSEAREINLTLELDEPEDRDALERKLVREHGFDPAEGFRVRRRAIDARHHLVRVQLTVEVGGAPEVASGAPLKDCKGSRRVIIVGDGPAGLFAAYELARHGIPATILERGKPVQPRRRDLKNLNARGVVNPDSNYCFGEGGAGTYSDGKLYTRSHKRGDVRDVLEVLALHGAPEDILVDARPHIGSNLLPKVVTALREALEAVGQEFRFEETVTDIDVWDGCLGSVITKTDRYETDALIIATGHSARDVYQMLHHRGVLLESKPFALGVRIEHPQALINQAQYGRFADHPRLPPASYRLTHEVRDRGVFSFCMCPGGWIVPAATEANALVVNGMSLSKRDSPYANSGLVVGIEPADWMSAGFDALWGGIEVQKQVEESAFFHGGKSLEAPATRVVDFLKRRASTTVPESSYLPGLAAADIREVLAQSRLDLAERLSEGLRVFAKRLRGFDSQDAVLVATESRSSSPVRVRRDPETLQTNIRKIYPCGEGAGYAGGIVSAAMDGLRVARAIAATW
jgi:uncharacterized FAD-dependent dehydrogenase